MLRVYQEGDWNMPQYKEVKSLDSGRNLAKKLMRQNENVSDSGVVDENGQILARAFRVYDNNKIKVYDYLT